MFLLLESKATLQLPTTNPSSLFNPLLYDRERKKEKERKRGEHLSRDKERVSYATKFQKVATRFTYSSVFFAISALNPTKQC